MSRTVYGIAVLSMLVALQPVRAYELSAFELQKTIDMLEKPDSGDPKDFSGVTLFEGDDGTQRILIADNGSTNLFEYDLDGKFYRMIRGKGFNDTEGIVHLGGDRFAIVEERIAQISIVTIDSKTTTLDKKDAQVIKPHLADGSSLNPDGKNLGLEGIAYDAKRNVFYVVKEKKGRNLYEVQIEGDPGAATLLEEPTKALQAELDDLAGVHFDNTTRTFFVLSHESDCITQVGLTGPCRGKLKLGGKQVEGISISPDGLDLVVVGEARQFFHYRRKQGSANADGQGSASPGVSHLGLYLTGAVGLVAVAAIAVVVVLSQKRS